MKDNAVLENEADVINIGPPEGTSAQSAVEQRQLQLSSRLHCLLQTSPGPPGVTSSHRWAPGLRNVLHPLHHRQFLGPAPYRCIAPLSLDQSK